MYEFPKPKVFEELIQALTALQQASSELDTGTALKLERLEQISQQLDLAEKACPDHQEVVEVRNAWFGNLIIAYEDLLEEDGSAALHGRVSELLSQYLRRHHLGKLFPDAFNRLEWEHQRWAKEASSPEERGAFESRIDSLRHQLLHGQLE